jgi:hypothetical protein
MLERTELPAPTDRQAREQVIAALERWKKWIYPHLPGEPLTLDEFGRLTSEIVSYCSRYLKHIDTTPMKRLWQMSAQRKRLAADPSLPWNPTEEQLVAVAHEAVGVSEDIKGAVQDEREPETRPLQGGPVRQPPVKRRGGKPLETRKSQKAKFQVQVYQRIVSVHQPNDRHHDTWDKLRGDRDFIEQVRAADLRPSHKLVRKALAWSSQRKRDAARKNQETVSE